MLSSKDRVKSVTTSVHLTLIITSHPLDISKNAIGQSCHKLYDEPIFL